MKKMLWRIVKFFDPAQQVLYDPRTHRFIHTKYYQDNGVICSDFCGYYNDSMTSIQRQLLSYDYIWGCEYVGAVDKFHKAELDSAIYAWKVSGY